MLLSYGLARVSRVGKIGDTISLVLGLISAILCTLLIKIPNFSRTPLRSSQLRGFRLLTPTCNHTMSKPLNLWGSMSSTTYVGILVSDTPSPSRCTCRVLLSPIISTVFPTTFPLVTATPGRAGFKRGGVAFTISEKRGASLVRVDWGEGYWRGEDGTRGAM